MMQNTVSVQLSLDECLGLEKTFRDAGWRKEPMENEYVVFRMENDNGSVAILYTSRKLVFQGKEDFDEMVSRVRQGLVAKEVAVKPHIGVDEVGKGDYFGPLVVVACFVNEDSVKKFLDIGVGDSKKFSDGKIMKMYEQMKDYEYYYPSIVMPEEYNALEKEIGNVAILLARQHSKVIEEGLKDLEEKGVRCDSVVIDQFSSRESRVKDELGELGREANFEQYHKGESDIAVACASVLARGIFLEEMEKMRKEYDFDFPKGATHVIERGKEFVKRYGADELGKVAKVSFKTTKNMLK
ncbi:MAG TPA: ribonuclease HIII [Candidatus Dojkabacteria bacterium]|nr:ribonuclease HIII [Candidatus Dojkabacteria bacterium]